MIAVLTGDIVLSSQHHKESWLPALKSVLSDWGAAPTDWEIYRGDEFQLRLLQPEAALMAAFRIKAHLKAVADTDVRMAIGLGPQNQEGGNSAADRSSLGGGGSIAEANGPAFIHSGRKLDEIKKERIQLAVASDNPDFDREMNLMLGWALLTADNWTTVSAEIVDLFLKHPQLSQTDIAQQLKIQQSAVSQRLKRAGFDLLWQLIEFSKDKIRKL